MAINNYFIEYELVNADLMKNNYFNVPTGRWYCLWP